MSTIKKRQHYVWRHYLKPWTNDGKIWACLKEKDKVIESGLMGVAQEKYFYELVDLSQDQKVKLKQFIDHLCHPSIQSMANDFFIMFTSHNTLRRKLDQTDISKNIEKELSEELEEMKKNMMENVHTKFEQFGFKLLDCSSISDIKDLSEDELIETLIFLCVQFIRTKARKEAVIRDLKSTPYSTFAEKFWNIISFVLALNMARNIYVHKNLCIRVYKNETSKKFLTGDQPIFNVLKDKLDENGKVEELELYYPISPKISLLIYFDSDDNKFQEVNIDKEKIELFNELIYDCSYFFVFADNQKQLNKF